MRRYLILPDLGIDEQPIVASLWLLRRGQHVKAGDRVLEVLAGAATVDLPAPGDGLLAETLISEGEPLQVGRRLAVIESDCQAEC